MTHDVCTEDGQVERPATHLFEDLGWETAVCFVEFDGVPSVPGSATRSEVPHP